MLIVGGQETTAMANACAIFMLAHHQNVQNKASIHSNIQYYTCKNVVYLRLSGSTPNWRKNFLC